MKEGILCIAICLWVIFAELTGIALCPFRFFFGLSCAGCGMSRAIHALFMGNIEAAFYFHPLFWMPVPAAVLYLFRQKIPGGIRKMIWGSMIFLIMAVYLFRLRDNTQRIVVFNPSDGMFFRLFESIKQMIREFSHIGKNI